MKKSRVAIASALAAFSLGLTGPESFLFGEPPGKVHLIIACDSSAEAGLGGDVVTDRHEIKKVFEENVPESQCDIHVIEGDRLRPSTIISTIKGLTVERHQDSIMFYFNGHGAYDGRRGHFFSLPEHQSLLRSEVVEAMIGQRPRSAVIITDCCAAGARFTGDVDSGKGFIERPETMSPLFRCLFFDVRGTVDITSSQPTEVSLTRGDGKGSLFTFALVEYLRRNSKQETKWDDLLSTVGKQVKDDFDKFTEAKGVVLSGPEGKGIHQMTQTVYAFARCPALGARAKAEVGHLKIVEIVPLSPADLAGLHVGDTLLRVNNTAVTTEQQFSRAVDDSQRSIRLIVRERDGKLSDITAELNKR